jgi:L-amino acid N-acyltransferase YncA
VSTRPAGPPRAGAADGRSVQQAAPIPADQITISELTAADWPGAARIYEAGIASGNATYEPRAPAWEAFSSGREGCPALVARDFQGAVLGWATLSRSSVQEVYRGVGTVSIYVDPVVSRRGVGSRLLGELIEASERAGFWTVEAGIFPENIASISLHKRLGFRLVGTRRHFGRMPDGRWRDELLYERRSLTVGYD